MKSGFVCKLRLIFFIPLMIITGSHYAASSDDSWSNIQDRSLTDVLDEISETYQVFFTYNDQLLRNVSVDFSIRENEKVETAVNRLLALVGFKYEQVKGKYFVIYEESQGNLKTVRKLKRKIHQIGKLERKGKIRLQRVKKKPEEQLTNVLQAMSRVPIDIEVNGTVRSQNGEPLIGATVVVKGSNNGTTTDVDGKFTLQVPDQSQSVSKLVISYVGMKSLEITVGNQTEFDIVLHQDITSLDEVIVTALGVLSKKKSLGYSATNLAGDELARSNESNAVNAMVGKVAGLQLTQSAAGLGGSSKVLLRGNSSLSGGNQPLYVVDGVPISNSGIGSAISGGPGVTSERSDFGSGISDINPDDIESVSVLKGPNAAALYGNRAANGAIIITTKKGRLQQGIGLSYSGSVMATSINENTLPEFQNEYGMGNSGIFAADAVSSSWGPKFDGTKFTYPSGIEGTYAAQPNNIKDFFNAGTEAFHSISLDAGSNKASIRFSYTNFKGKGVIPNMQLDKNTFNIRASTQISDKLEIDSKATYFTQKGQNRPVMGWSGRNVLNHVYRWNRNAVTSDYEDYYVVDNISSDPYFFPGQVTDNPYYIINQRTNEDFRNRLIGFLKATYAFNDNLSAFARIGTDTYSHLTQYIIPSGGDARQPEGRINDSDLERTETNADFLLMYNGKLSSGLNLEFNAGGNYRLNVNKSISKAGIGFKIPGAPATYSNVLEVNPGSSTPAFGVRSSVYSAYFSGTLDFSEKVYLSFSGRNDWDSRLWTRSATDTDWSFFYPSVSLSVLPNDLLGISDNSILSFSKVRIAWAEVGAGGSKTDRIRYSIAGGRTYNDLVSVRRNDVFDDPTLRPESTVSQEIGLELKFFNYRLYADFTYYNQSTGDQIINAPIDASSGFSFIRTNIGEISNKGFEFLIGGTPFQTNSFSWDASLNIAKNSSVLESFVDGVDSYLFTGHENFAVKTKVGGNYGDIWGNNFVYDANGKIVVGDNGLPIATEEEELLGNYYPDCNYSGQKSE